MNNTNFLTKILAHKEKEVAKQKRIYSEKALQEMLLGMPGPRSLIKEIREKEDLAIIAEMKKASPSAGVIRQDFFPEWLAKEYERGGASAISVLTDVEFFQGSVEYLRQIRSLVNIPLLRKDFIIDPYQILEARAYGADAVLLIVAALSKSKLKALFSEIQEYGMDALVEVHNERELEIALDVGAKLIGINNRDLESFHIDLAVTERLAAQVPADITLVGESGIHTIEDVMRMKAAGVHALLIGTHFIEAILSRRGAGRICRGNRAFANRSVKP